MGSSMAELLLKRHHDELVPFAIKSDPRCCGRHGYGPLDLKSGIIEVQLALPADKESTIRSWRDIYSIRIATKGHLCGGLALDIQNYQLKRMRMRPRRGKLLIKEQSQSIFRHIKYAELNVQCGRKTIWT